MLRKSKLVLLVCIMLVTSLVKSENQNVSDDIAKKSIELLRSIESMKFKQYYLELTEEEDMLDFSKENVVDRDELKKIENYLELQFIEMQKFSFEKIKEIGRAENINWKDIKFAFFQSHNLKIMKNGAPAYQGILYFSSKDNYFKVRISGFLYKNQINLAGIRGLETSSKEELQLVIKEK